MYCLMKLRMLFPKQQHENIMSVTGDGIREGMKEWDPREWKQGVLDGGE